MSYVDTNLMQGETVKYRAKLHKILFLKPMIFIVALVLVGIAILLNFPEYPQYGYFCFIVAALCLLPTYIQYISSEFAITNKRVIIKTGFIYRQTMETLLQKIEAINVDQSILGRVFNYGTITITGTGGTRETFQGITDPLAFRRAVQEQTDAKEDAG